MGKSLKAWLPVGALGLAASALAAPLLAPGHPLAALLIRNFFSPLCHQNPARSFVLEGSPAAVCVRCLGIYLGAALGGFLALEQTIALRCLWLAVLLNGLDIVTETVRWHGNMPLPRFFLGLLLGAAGGALLCARRHGKGARGYSAW